MAGQLKLTSVNNAILKYRRNLEPRVYVHKTHINNCLFSPSGYYKIDKCLLLLIEDSVICQVL